MRWILSILAMTPVIFGAQALSADAVGTAPLSVGVTGSSPVEPSRNPTEILRSGDTQRLMLAIAERPHSHAEVEAAIGAHPEVLSSAVIGLPDEDRGHQVHAIVQRADGSELWENTLIAKLVPDTLGISLDESVAQSPDLRARIDADKHDGWDVLAGAALATALTHAFVTPHIGNVDVTAKIAADGWYFGLKARW